MAYAKQEWKDRVVENPMRYTIEEHEDGSITLTPLTGAIYEVGTPVNAHHMNHMEEGIANALTNESPCSRFSWQNISGIGSRIVIDNAGNNAAVSYADNSGKLNNKQESQLSVKSASSAATATKWNEMELRTGSGLSGVAGCITLTW